MNEGRNLLIGVYGKCYPFLKLPFIRRYEVEKASNHNTQCRCVKAPRMMPETESLHFISCSGASACNRYKLAKSEGKPAFDSCAALHLRNMASLDVH